MKKIVIIAAAGKGKRLGAGVPKCLIKINGHAIFEYLLRAFDWADEIRMVIGYKAEEVKEQVTKINPKVVFITNERYDQTNTLQSNYLGAKGLDETVLFIDGDMIISKRTSEMLYKNYIEGNEFVSVSTEISEEPVYADVENGIVNWLEFERKTKYEWANVALINPSKLEYLPTYFFVQISKFLPMRAVEIERLEIDTIEDLKYATEKVVQCPEKYDFWM